MARPKNPVPAYRLHKSGKAIIEVYTDSGRRTAIMLPGPYGSEESRAEYARVLAILATNNGQLPTPKSNLQAGDATISELVLRFFDEKVAVDYLDAYGKPTSEAVCYRQALKPLVRLFGSTNAREFDAAALGMVRQSMLSGSWMNDQERALILKRRQPLGWARSNTNKAISRVRSLFRWAHLQKLIDSNVVTSLECLPPLKPGRGGARESEPVVPVDPNVVELTLPHLGPVTADMVRVQLLIACRPGELCDMRNGDIDRSGPAWIFSPRTHKNLHRGHKRTIAIGPQAQLILQRWLKDDPGAFVFSPAEQDEILKSLKRGKRKSKVPPSQFDRSKPTATRKPKNQFTTTSYNRAIRRACERAGIDYWHAHQLRHTAALLIEREFGAEGARAVLGHRTINMTLHYSGVDVSRASEIARMMG